MADEKYINVETESINEDNSTDIIEKLTNFVCYLKIGDECQMLLKPSETEFQNEKKFKQRAEKILKHYHRHDQTKIEEKIINELQQNLYILNNDLENEINKEKLEPNNIAEICDKVMILKMLNIKNLKNIKSLEDFIKFNKTSLKDITKIEKEIKDLLDNLSPKEKSSKKSEIKAPRTINTLRDRRSPMSYSNLSRRNEHDVNNRVHPRNHVERFRRFENMTNDNIIIESQTYTNELFRPRLENDQTRVVENFINRSNIDQNTRYRHNEDMVSRHDLISSIDDDLVEFSSLNSTVNLYKENEENNSGDVHLILHPLTVPI